MLAVDVNNDGILDLVTADVFGGNVAVCLGDGAGHFGAPIDSPAGQYPHLLQAADFAHSGNLDLAVPNLSEGQFSLMLGSGTGAFAAPIAFPTGGSNSRCVAVGDFLSNGQADVAVSDPSANKVYVFINTTNPTSPILKAMGLVTHTVVGGGTVKMTLVTTSPAPANGLIVTLSSSDPSVVTVPRRVTIPAGQTHATVTLTTSPPDSSEVVTITSSVYGLVSKQVELTVVP